MYDDTDRKYVKFSKTFEKLDRAGKFSPSEAKLICHLNKVRNHLRETHGFYVTDKAEVKKIMDGIELLLRRLASQTKVWAIREKLDFAFQLELDVFFDVEVALDAYLEPL